MRDFLRRTFFVDRRKQVCAVTVERRRKMTVSSASKQLEDSIDRFALSMKRIREKVEAA